MSEDPWAWGCPSWDIIFSFASSSPIIIIDTYLVEVYTKTWSKITWLGLFERLILCWYCGHGHGLLLLLLQLQLHRMSLANLVISVSPLNNYSLGQIESRFASRRKVSLAKAYSAHLLPSQPHPFRSLWKTSNFALSAFRVCETNFIPSFLDGS